MMLAMIVLGGFVADDAHALLCARRNSAVVSRTACKRHEQAISVDALLPPPVVHSAFSTNRVGPVAVPNPGGDFGTFITPIAALTALPAGSYVVTATAFCLGRSIREGRDRDAATNARPAPPRRRSGCSRWDRVRFQRAASWSGRWRR